MIRLLDVDRAAIDTKSKERDSHLHCDRTMEKEEEEQRLLCPAEASNEDPG